MSLVRPAELSAASYANRKLYLVKGNSESSTLSTQMFSSDQRNLMCTSDAYSSKSAEPNYLIDSLSEDLILQSSSDLSGNSFHPEGASSSFTERHHDDAYRSNYVSEYFESQSTDGIDYDENTMRLKLQELERALLDDNDDEDDDMFDADQSIEIENDWSDPIKNSLLNDSPKESSSSDSNLTTISSSKEVSLASPMTPKKLLYECASAISEGNIEVASAIINELRQLVSIQGDPPQRIAAYMVEGLAARMAASGRFLYKALKCKEPPSTDRLAAMQILFEVCPCFKFGFMAANGAITDACKDEKKVHIIDFDINQGSQYITLIQTLAKRPGKLPKIRLTGVDDPETVQRTVGGLKVIGQRLEKLAEALGVPFEFRAVAAKTSNATPSMLKSQPGEALLVNFAFQLHHMPDESVSIVNQRDQLLQMVKGMNPKLVTVVEQDVNTNTSPFFPRFIEAYNYYSAVFESLDATLPRESQDRINVEKQCLARDIVNIVACEGEERIERYEVAGKWRARMTMAGFTPCPMSRHVNDSIKESIRQQYCDRYKVKEDMGALHFGWEDKNLIVASAWR